MVVDVWMSGCLDVWVSGFLGFWVGVVGTGTAILVIRTSVQGGGELVMIWLAGVVGWFVGMPSGGPN